MINKVLEELKGLEMIIEDGSLKGCLVYHESVKSFIKQKLEEKDGEIEKLKEALIWCSGSDDFQIEGKGRIGWEKICLPLLKKAGLIE